MANASYADQLTEGEINEIKLGFAKFDEYDDGTIPTKKLTEVMKSLGQNLCESEINKLTNELDEDANGLIEFPNFLEALARCIIETRRREDIKEAFAVFDRDGSGTIDSREIINIFRKIGDRKLEATAKEIFAEADIDQNGVINYEEFANLLVAE